MTDQRNALQIQVRSLSDRDGYLWAITATLLVLVAVGFVALIAPNLIWRKEELKIDSEYLPQLFNGLLVLIGLFTIYCYDQRRRINTARDVLLQRMMSEQAATETMGLLDRETQTYTAAALEQLVSRFLKDATIDNPLSVLHVEIHDFAKLKRRHGSVACEHMVRGLAEILKKALRGSDPICRESESRFVVFMPETPSSTCHIPMERIFSGVHRWNNATRMDYKLSIRMDAATYTGTESPDLVHDLATRDAFLTAAPQASQPVVIH